MQVHYPVIEVKYLLSSTAGNKLQSALSEEEGCRAPVVAQRVKMQHSVCEDSGSIPDLAQLVKDLALLQAAAEAGSCSSDSTPSRRTSICLRCDLKEKKKKKKRRLQRNRVVGEIKTHWQSSRRGSVVNESD